MTTEQFKELKVRIDLMFYFMCVFFITTNLNVVLHK